MVDKTAPTVEESSAERRAQINIRLATAADLKTLEWDGEYTYYRRLFRRAIDEAERGRRVLLLAEIGDQVVGQIFVQLMTRATFSTQRASSGYLYAFRVKPPYRNRGVGSHLLHAAEDKLESQGFRRAVISVAKSNLAAKRLYERAGYVVFTVDPGEWSYLDHEGQLREVLEPAFVMEKWL